MLGAVGHAEALLLTVEHQDRETARLQVICDLLVALHRDVARRKQAHTRTHDGLAVLVQDVIQELRRLQRVVRLAHELAVLETTIALRVRLGERLDADPAVVLEHLVKRRRHQRDLAHAGVLGEVVVRIGPRLDRDVRLVDPHIHRLGEAQTLEDVQQLVEVAEACLVGAAHHHRHLVQLDAGGQITERDVGLLGARHPRVDAAHNRIIRQRLLRLGRRNGIVVHHDVEIVVHARPRLRHQQAVVGADHHVQVIAHAVVLADHLLDRPRLSTLCRLPEALHLGNHAIHHRPEIATRHSLCVCVYVEEELPAEFD